MSSNLNVYYKVFGVSSPGNDYYNNWAANVLTGAGLKILSSTWNISTPI